MTETPRRPGGPRRPPPRQVEVVATRRLTPNLLAITFGGESLATFAEPVPTGHLKVFLPEADGSMRVGVAGADGMVEWPDGRPTMRTYTPRRFDPESKTIEVWFVLHGDGPAAQWAARATVGDRAAIGGPGGRFSIEPDATQWWIAGDTSAVPAVATLIEALPSDATAEIHLEVDSADDQITLPDHAGATVTWHVRAEGQTPGETLLEAVTSADVSPGTHLWAGCEAAAVRRIRAHALGELGLPRDHVTTRGYWRIGAANHPDHDYGED
ncbi:siderophore-interacting protein [Nocardioides sp. Kera G14]|uniref:siderophore-interacting protein n=1 Tax=Nocardioides sp. Kera G14 TaxID=2884264 RepID=UPI001D123152|nr:siderophore-interacting protein [Nocardioides sp. Kera G14]UDY23460.1 siderophore-interacting protein [Nocardioides sp. Kera G14]